MIDRLRINHDLPDEDLKALLESPDASLRQDLFAAAREVRDASVGHCVRLRALIEVNNRCLGDCLYCGIRRSNSGIIRYSLSSSEILESARLAYGKGVRTFVLQGGENPTLAARLISTVGEMHGAYPDAVITLSLGELPYETYAAFRKAGAGRFLLRHETATEAHYAQLHPAGKSLASRLSCARELRRLGFEVGLGMMVGSPFQTTGLLIADLRLLQQFRPEMIGCGPFIPHHSTPFAYFPSGSAETTLRIYAILRLMLPTANIPSTTALAVLQRAQGSGATCASELCAFPGLEAGANVLMPNFTPKTVRAGYDLYEGKTKQDTNFESITSRLKENGYDYV